MTGAPVDVLVVGGGGREHALCWALRRSPSAGRVLCAPGNAGIEADAALLDVRTDDTPGLVSAARAAAVHLAVVGPDAPLAAGLADALRAAGIPVFGPDAGGARIESSKSFAKALMAEAGVPTARYAVADSPAAAHEAIAGFGGQVAVKADALAAGKGVVVCETETEAMAATRRFLAPETAGGPPRRVVIEERLSGPELSLIALTDGHALAMLPPAQDHKRLSDGDLGPNTGGMGAYAPADPGEEVLAVARDRIFRPVLAALARRGIAYRGALYAGLMLTRDGPKVLEFNSRFGDPETQAIVPILADDLLPALLAAARGTLEDADLAAAPRAAVCVVLASGSYPGAPSAPRAISGIERAASMEGVLVFHAGTRRVGGALQTAGGRVLGVTGVARDVPSARALAYRAADEIGWEGIRMRRDIALRPLAPGRTAGQRVG